MSSSALNRRRLLQAAGVAGFLDKDTAEACNTYNMLKLTRELWLLDPNRASYFDFYERALLNHLLGQQDPNSAHGHVCYFTALNPGGRRSVAGPVVGGATCSADTVLADVAAASVD